MRPLFSILVVCLNPGEKLEKTLQSILRQSYEDYEIVIKDGLSDDGSLSYARNLKEERIRILERKDTGIYDAMNQAAQAACGRYVYFLNCGDLFYEDTVLEKMACFVKEKPVETGIYYGNIYERLTGQVVASNPRIDAFGCYRNVPCHQACFYDSRLLKKHPFNTAYRVRADYEQFLWCFFTKEIPGGVNFCYREILIADYEGGGFSESRENRKKSQSEHREITARYMSRGQRMKYKLILWITLAPVRTGLASNPLTAGVYNRWKKLLYKSRQVRE